MDEGARGLEHRVDSRRDALTVHPVERLCESRHSEAAELGRQLLGTQVFPTGVLNAALARLGLRFGDHAGVGVEPDDLLEQRGELQGDDARPAPDVEQSPSPVEPKSSGHGVGHAGGVREPALPVEARTPGVQGRIPSELHAGEHGIGPLAGPSPD